MIHQTLKLTAIEAESDKFSDAEMQIRQHTREGTLARLWNLPKVYKWDGMNWILLKGGVPWKK